MTQATDQRGRLDIYPSIDLRGGKVVRLAQGDFDRQTSYDLDPADTARRWADAGARFLHVVDLDGAKAGAVAQARIIADIARAEPRLLVQAGGGVRSNDDVRKLLGAGCGRVVVGTKGVSDWPWLEALVSPADMDGKIVLAIDAKAGKIAVGGWQETTDLTAIDVARRAGNLPLAGLLYTDVARDGMLGGSDVPGTSEIADATPLPVLASGGIGSADDLRPLVAANVAGVVIGRSLHEGKLDLAEALEIDRGA